MGRRAKTPKTQAGAKRPRTSKTPKDDVSKVRELDNRLAESLEREKATSRALTEAVEQHAATTEILRVIHQSPMDAQPVFDTIARSASLLCGGEYAIVTRFDGALLHLVGQYNARPRAAERVARLFPGPPRRDSSIGRAILDRVRARRT